MINITKAQKTDLDKIVNLRLLAQQNTASLDEDTVVSKKTEKELKEITEHELNDPRIIYLLAMENEEPIAFVILSFASEVDKSAYLGEIFVKEEYRNQGLGGNLINEAMEIAKDKGLKKIRISVAKNNLSAQNLYRQLGFLPKEREYLLFEKEL